MLQKLQEFKSALLSRLPGEGRAKYLNLVGIVILVAAVPLTVFVALQQQDLRQRAQVVSAPFPPGTIFGKAAKFDNLPNSRGDVIYVQNNPSLNPRTALTVEVWIKPRSVNRRQGIIQKIAKTQANTAKTQYFIGITPVTQTTGALYTCVGVETGNDMCLNVAPTAGIEANKWYHVAMVFDNGKLQVFTDGQGGSSLTRDGAVLHTYFPETLMIGSAIHNDNAYSDFYGFDGEIDELRISDTARYSAVYTPLLFPFFPDANTKALWHFDGNSNDVSGNGNNGNDVGPIEYVDSDIVRLIPSPVSSEPIVVPPDTNNPVVPVATQIPIPTKIPPVYFAGCANSEGKKHITSTQFSTIVCTGWDQKEANSHPSCKNDNLNPYYFTSCVDNAPQPLPTSGDLGHCANSEGKRHITSTQFSDVVCTGWVKDNHSCESDNLNYYYYTTCSR